MPRHSILREIQEEAYAPKKKPSPAPLILSLLLPLLLIPAILPIVDLVTTPPSQPTINLPIGSADSIEADLTVRIAAGGRVVFGSEPETFPHAQLPTKLAAFPVENPKILLLIDSNANTSDLLPVLETLESCNIGEISFSTAAQPPTPPTPSIEPRHPPDSTPQSR